MGFTKQIISQWGLKSSTPELRRRLEKAGFNWLKRKFATVRRSLKAGDIDADEAANQYSFLEKFMRFQVESALTGRRDGGPADSGPPSKRPLGTRDSGKTGKTLQ